jgi:glycosyltransferase involved in cell wall biosynthesis
MIRPKVSVVIPTYNEREYIIGCLDSIVDDFVSQNAEVLISDGMSEDGTPDLIRKYQKKHPEIEIKILNNLAKHQSYGTNDAIKRARGEIIVWIGAHAVYPKNYVKRCVDLLEKTGADNVGGAIHPKWKTGFQKLVAVAVSNSFGVGNARFRLGNFKGNVDTVFPGTFRKSTFEKVGDLDPYTNQDAEFNLRILNSGGKIYMDSSIKVGYFPKSSLSALIKQYFNYGKGRCRTTLKHRQFTSPRQLAPIVLVFGITASFLLSVFLNPIFLLLPISYVVLDIAASFSALRGNNFIVGDVFVLAVIFASMHIFWGLGFTAYLIGVSR